MRDSLSRDVVKRDCLKSFRGHESQKYLNETPDWRDSNPAASPILIAAFDYIHEL
jgi:hypothetical protein